MDRDLTTGAFPNAASISVHEQMTQDLTHKSDTLWRLWKLKFFIFTQSFVNEDGAWFTTMRNTWLPHGLSFANDRAPFLLTFYTSSQFFFLELGVCSCQVPQCNLLTSKQQRKSPLTHSDQVQKSFLTKMTAMRSFSSALVAQDANCGLGKPCVPAKVLQANNPGPSRVNSSLDAAFNSVIATRRPS